jgi:hypothetical protein
MEVLEPRLVLDASMLRITEFGASNHNVINDFDGDASDWIEVYNSGSDAVGLSGMHLTDDATNLTKWTLPAGTNLAGGGYLVVFASGKNTVEPNGELHTNFKLSADGEYLGLVDVNGTTILDQYAPTFPPQLDDISYGRAMQDTGASTTIVAPGASLKAIIPVDNSAGLNWTQASYNDGAWPISGTTGLGYENSPGDPINYASQIHTTVPSGTTTAYMRVMFNLSSLVGIDKLTLRMKFDDGFVAYINGNEVAEANNPEVVAWNSIAATTHDDAAALQYVDYDVSNFIRQLHTGQNVLAIQVLNVANSSDMLMVPELDAQAATLVSPAKIGYFDTPTPGYANGDSVAGFAESPVFSVPHGYYNSTQFVAISSPTPGAIIVYTTNGSTPQVDANLNVTNGTLYASPLSIGATTTLRATTFKAGFKPSYVAASTYIFVTDVINQSPLGQVPPGWPANGVNGQSMDYGIDPDIIALYGAQAVENSLASLPAISITTDLSNLFDPATGIYVNALNRGRTWERPASVELINLPGASDDGFDVNAGLRIRGGYSRNDFDPKHAFRLYFRGEYGDSKLDYPLFGDEGTDEFDVLDLRTDQNYSWASTGDIQNSMVREVFGRDLQRDMGQPYTRSRYYQLYIDGQFWGVYQTEERPQEDYGASYFGGNQDDYDVVKSGIEDVGATEIAAGNDTAWHQLFTDAQTLAANPIASANLYWTMQGLNPDGTRNPNLPVLLDVDNLVDYMADIFYTGGFDTGLSQFFNNNEANNWFGIYNHTTADQGFQFFIHDNEHSLGVDPSTVHGSLNIDRTGPFNNGNQHNYAQYNPQYLHQDLMASPEYKQRFIDEVQRLFFNDGPLTVNNDIARLMERVDEVDPAVIAEAARWGDAKVAVPRNKTTWQTEINWIINTYFPTRGNTVLLQLSGDGLYSFPAAAFSRLGGTVPNFYPLTLSGAGTIYYTTDGSDPRLVGGGINPTAKIYTGAISISGTPTIKTRSLSAGKWSGVVSAAFNTVDVPGDYNGSGSVDQADFNVWMANFGSTSFPAADGNHDGVVDAADYAVWRDHFGTSIQFGLAAADSDVDLEALLAKWYAEVADTPTAPTTGAVAESAAITSANSLRQVAIAPLFESPIAAFKPAVLPFGRPATFATPNNQDDLLLALAISTVAVRDASTELTVTRDAAIEQLTGSDDAATYDGSQVSAGVEDNSFASSLDRL